MAQTPRATFFQSLDWLRVYWRHFGQGQKLRAMIARRGGEVVGVVPLVVVREPTRVGPLRVLTYPLHDWGSFYGPVSAEPKAVLSAALRHVARTRRDWDILELRWVHPDDVAERCTQQALHQAGLRAARSVWNHTALVDLRGTWQQYQAAKPSKWRNNCHRWERRLAEQGSVTYIRYRPRGQAHGEGDPRWDLYDACEELARRSWQGCSTTGTTLSHESVRPFFREAHAAAARAGCLDLNLLLLNGQPVAFAYNYWYQGRVYGLRVGYDAGVSRQGAGNVLYLRALRDSFQRNDSAYDLGVGSLDIKWGFLTHIVPIYRFSYYAPGAPRAQVVRLKRWIWSHWGPAEAMPAPSQPK